MLRKPSIKVIPIDTESTVQPDPPAGNAPRPHIVARTNAVAHRRRYTQILDCAKLRLARRFFFGYSKPKELARAFELEYDATWEVIREMGRKHWREAVEQRPTERRAA